MADMSVSGIASGINWDEMIAKILDKAKKPALVMVEKRDKLTRKQEYFEEFQIALQKLNSALSPLKLPSTYKAKGLEIERVDKSGSYKGVLTATANADAEVDVHDLEVLKLAKSQVQRSNAFTDKLSGAFTGALSGASEAHFWIGIGGRRLRIEVRSDDTLESLAKRINTALKTQRPPFGVTASVVDNKLILKSDATGLGKDTQKAAMTRSGNAYDLLENMHIDSGSLKSGDLVVKSKKGDRTWKQGVDFDVVAGNQIRWRDYEPQTVPAGETYQVKYKAESGDVYTTGGAIYGPSDIVRGKGDVDKDALPFTPRAALSTTNISVQDRNGVTYQYGTDFTIEGKSVKWLGMSRPGEGVEY